MFTPAAYQRLPCGAVKRLRDGACFDPDPANRDYAEFLAYESAGGAVDDCGPPAPAEPVSAPPRIVAAAIGIIVAGGDVAAVPGSYNVTAALYLGVGTIMLVFLNEIPAISFVSGNAGTARVTASELDPGYCILEIRDAGGDLTDPPLLDVAVTAL